MIAQVLNVLVGVWLFFSAFAWPHTHAQMTNAVLGAIACGILAVLGFFFGPARYLGAALGVWVFLSAFLLPTQSRVTLWNDSLIGIAMFVTFLSGRPIEERELRLRRERAAPR